MSEKKFSNEKSSLKNQNKEYKNISEKEKTEKKYYCSFEFIELDKELNISMTKKIKDTKINMHKISIDSKEQNLHKFFNYDLINSLLF